MELTLIIALLLAVLVGVSLGLLGGGGSILTVPILTYVVGMDAREAIASSLFIVGVTSAVSVLSHARAGRVRWKTGLIFGGAGMVGAFAGGLAGGYIAEPVLMVLFAGMMVATATAMIRGRKVKAEPADAEREGLPMARIVLDGFLVGLATGLVGAGGGFLIVPALNLLGGLPMAVAVATSLLVIVMKSFAGLAGYLFSVQLNWPLLTVFTAVAIAGSFLGVKLAGIVPERSLRKGFGWFVLAMGAFVLVQEVPKLFAGFA
ncbi:MAG: sulfite exporter TauE/SafE family protein [Leucobacter sp.]|nr:sulfite exporter TauE/SafE family protein [Leucobacter sp.]